MRHPTRLVVLLALPTALAIAAADSAPDGTDRNARLVEKYRREDRAYYDRLRNDLRAFYLLPADKQERMRQLDRNLSEENSPSQRHLWEVLDRFNAWLDRLPEEERRKIEDAPSREERLRLIRDMREQEFVRNLPRKVREQLETLPPDRRAARIAQIRQEELAVRQTWNPRPNYPVRPSDLWLSHQEYLEKVLIPTLSPAEKDELKTAEGQWPEFARTLLRLVDKHQFKGPTRNEVHPAEARALTRQLKEKERKILHAAEGKFPEYGETFMRLARPHKGLKFDPPPGPGRLEDLPPLHQAFVQEILLPLLGAVEKDELQKLATDRKWPDYPVKVLMLAAKYNREVPLLDFPGADDLWDRTRPEVADLPEVPDRELRSFLRELTATERAEGRLSLEDSESRDRLRQEYFKRYPSERDRLLRIDKRALNPKKGGVD